jgi:hypothetical protein
MTESKDPAFFSYRAFLYHLRKPEMLAYLCSPCPSLLKIFDLDLLVVVWKTIVF